VSVGKKLDDEDLICYILAGLDCDFDSVISVMAARVKLISVSELYGQLVYHEQRKELCGWEYSTTNTATKVVLVLLAMVASVVVLLLDVDVAGTTTQMVENALNASCVAGRDIKVLQKFWS
jgi:hypothetical protein